MDEETTNNQDNLDETPEAVEKSMGPAPEVIKIPNPTSKASQAPVPEPAIGEARDRLVQEIAKDTYVGQPSEKQFTNFVAENKTKKISEEAPLLPVPKDVPQGRDDVIRTYESDVQDTIRNQKLSLTNIAIAESRQRTKEDVPAETKQKSGFWKRILLNILSAIIVSASIGVFAFLYLQYQEQQALPITVGPIDTLALANKNVSLNVTGLTRTSLPQVLEEISIESSGNLGDVINITLTNDETSNSITATEFIKLLEADSDPALLRSIEDEFMLGLHLLGKAHYFLIIKTNSFENVFAGMLRWEDTIADELPFLVRRIEIPEPLTVATSTNATTTNTTATSSEPVAKEIIEILFKDIVVENKDVRARRATDGEIDILYTFIDPETLIITNNTDTMKAILDRLTIARFKQ